jgi:hypothetical protein
MHEEEGFAKRLLRERAGGVIWLGVSLDGVQRWLIMIALFGKGFCLTGI